MKRFPFERFVSLLVRVLEIGIIAAFAVRWFDATLAFWYKIPLPRAAYDAVLNFSFLAIVLLLVATLWFLSTRQPRASVLAMRTSIYLVAFFVSPTRMPAHGGDATNKKRDRATSITLGRSAAPVLFARMRRIWVSEINRG